MVQSHLASAQEPLPEPVGLALPLMGGLIGVLPVAPRSPGQEPSLVYPLDTSRFMDWPSYLAPGSGAVARLLLLLAAVAGLQQPRVQPARHTVAPRTQPRNRCRTIVPRPHLQGRPVVVPCARLRSRLPGRSSRPDARAWRSCRTLRPAQEPLPGFRVRGRRDLRRSGRLRAPIRPHASGTSLPLGWRIISWL